MESLEIGKVAVSTVWQKFFIGGGLALLQAIESGTKWFAVASCGETLYSLLRTYLQGTGSAGRCLSAATLYLSVSFIRGGYENVNSEWIGQRDLTNIKEIGNFYHIPLEQLPINVFERRDDQVCSLGGFETFQ